MAVTPMFDRASPVPRPKAQLGFIGFVVKPLYTKCVPSAQRAICGALLYENMTPHMTHISNKRCHRRV